MSDPLRESLEAFLRTPKGQAIGKSMRRQMGVPDFRIEEDPTAVGGHTITCLVCRTKSYHPEDVRNRYCGRCHVFHEGGPSL